MKHAHLIACHECDLVHQLGAIPQGGAARCSRCGATLYRPKTDSLNRTLALALAGLILYIIANTYPFLGFQIGAQIRETTLATGIYQLYQQEMNTIATLVLITVVIVPAVHLLCMLYILLPLNQNVVPHHLAGVLRLVIFLKPWGMMEVFLLGILVSVVKLVKMATIIPGVALYAFLALIFVLAAMMVTLDEHVVWEKLEPTP
ncbi:MAG: paraquat-inducible protein A [Desulfobacterales bacterium]|nr:paraquat-inducible protein A [Desulfobacterales bacterium]